MPQLLVNPIHLGVGGSALVQCAFDGPEWFSRYAARTSIEGSAGRLVTQHIFTESWAEWEVHPFGAEVILCTQGSLKLTQEFADGRMEATTLSPGDYAINEPGVWHTADLDPGTEATCVFITSGQGTTYRPR